MRHNMDASLVSKIPGQRFCWVSGMAQRPKGWGGDWWLQVAHIAPGQGSAMRVNDRRAVVLLCPLLHDLHVVNCATIPEKVINGVSYPTIDISNLLYVKAYFDPEYYDEDYLNELFNKKLPFPSIPHERWQKSMQNLQGLSL